MGVASTPRRKESFPHRLIVGSTAGIRESPPTGIYYVPEGITVKTGTDFCDAVRKHILENPDVTYVRSKGYCSYSSGMCSNDTVGCLIGQVLGQFGYDTTVINDSIEAYDIDDILFDYHRKCRQDPVIDPESFSPAERRWLQVIQYHQDNGSTWKESLEHADKIYFAEEKD